MNSARQINLPLPAPSDSESYAPAEAVTALDAIAVALKQCNDLLCCVGNTAEELTGPTAVKAVELTDAALKDVREARKKVVLAAACFARFARAESEAA